MSNFQGLYTNLFSLRLNQWGILEKAKSISNVNLFQ